MKLLDPRRDQRVEQLFLSGEVIVERACCQSRSLADGAEGGPLQSHEKETLLSRCGGSGLEPEKEYAA